MRLQVHQATKAAYVVILVAQIVARRIPNREPMMAKARRPRTCLAASVVRREGGGWPNEGAFVRRLGWPACTALFRRSLVLSSLSQ